jgi:epoxyqueuosine reductase
VPVLIRALEDEEPLIRGHAAWALGRIGTMEAGEALRSREAVEEDEWAREEMALAFASHADACPGTSSALSSDISPGARR